MAEGSGSQVVFSSCLSTAAKEIERNGQTQCYSKAGVTGRIWGLFDHRIINPMPGWLMPDGMHLRGKRGFCTGVRRAYQQNFKLDWNGERKKTRLATNKYLLGRDMKVQGTMC